MAKSKVKESSVHKQVTDWLKWQHPAILFHTDFAAGVRMSIGQAVKNASLQSGKSWPDLFIPEPKGNFHGLFIEIKKDVEQVYKKDLTLRSIPHIHEQHAMLMKLQAKGYHAVFGCGFEQCKMIIEKYLTTPH